MLSLNDLKDKKVEAKRNKYEKGEIDSYLELVYSNYDEALREIERLKSENGKVRAEQLELNDKIKTLSDGVQYYRSIETTLQKALVLAEKTSKETKDAAVVKAEKIEKDAHVRADKIIMKAKTDYNAVREKTIQLLQQYKQFKDQIKRATETQVRFLNSSESRVTKPMEFETAVKEMKIEGAKTGSSDSSTPSKDADEGSSTPGAPQVPPNPKQTISLEADLEKTKVFSKIKEPLDPSAKKSEPVAAAVNTPATGTTNTPKVQTPSPATSPVTSSMNEVKSEAASVLQTAAKEQATVEANVNAETEIKEKTEDKVSEIKKTTSDIQEEIMNANTMDLLPTYNEVQKKTSDNASESATQIMKELKAETQSGESSSPLDALLKDLNENNKTDDKDPFSFLGSVEDDL